MLLHSIVANHPLADGTERLGWLAAVVFYGINDVNLDAPDDPAYDVVIEVASGGLDVQAIAAALAGWHD